MIKIQELIGEVRNELGSSFMATDIVDLKDGLPIASATVSPNINADENVARMTMVMKLAMRVSDKIKIGEVEDMLTTIGSGYLLMKTIGDGSYYWILLVNEDATLGMTRIIMNEYADKIWNAIPK